MIFPKGRIAGLFCTIATLAGAIYILQKLGTDENISKLSSFLDPRIVFLLLILYGLHFFAEPFRWVIYSTLPAFKPAAESSPANKVGRIFASFNITALLSYSLPFKLGLPIRLFLLSHSQKLKSTTVIKLMAVDGLFNLFAWFAVSSVLILFLPEMFVLLSEYLNFYYVVIAAVFVFSIVSWVLYKKGAQLLKTLKAIPLPLISLIILTLVIDVFLYGVRHMVLIDVLGIDIAAGKIFIIGVVAVFIGIISTLPMGLGAYDASLVALLGLYGIDLELGLIVAFSNRLGMIITSIILGVPSAFVMLKGEHLALSDIEKNPGM
ncbi:MAG: uncharacterized membrane protein YbhN (UPF0104 family) [Pseudohongiellaceae bacterium]|jgi:uncharacterized membrane protein YbhN (UPF0104 family)